MFGFGMEFSKETQLNHYFLEPGYFMPHSILPGGNHDFDQELRFFATLHHQGLIRMFPPPEALTASDKYALHNGYQTLMGANDGRIRLWDRWKSLMLLRKVLRRRKQNIATNQSCIFT